jgi:hypothetical protein
MAVLQVDLDEQEDLENLPSAILDDLGVTVARSKTAPWSRSFKDVKHVSSRMMVGYEEEK